LSKYIQNLIDQGENQMLDFKFEISDARKIAKTLVAFSNTDGGKLLIGVKDNGKIAWIRSEEEYHMLEAAADLYCRPAIPFEVQKWTIHGKTILEVDIARADRRPCLAENEHARWMAYLRVEDQNLLANRVMMKVWRKEKRKKGILLKYSNAEKLLLNYLKTNDSITLSKFCRISHIRLKQAEEILSDLIILEIIQIHMSEKGAKYSLISQT